MAEIMKLGILSRPGLVIEAQLIDPGKLLKLRRSSATLARPEDR